MESSGQRARGNHNHHHHERVSSHVNNNNNHWRETDTTSSRTSNSGSSNRFVKSNRRSNTEGNFSLRLPKRCSYPHQNITGTYYTVLGVDPHATHEQIVAQYTLWRKEGFRRMRQIDPTNVEAVDSLITEARNVLGHPALRIEYDETVRVATKSLTHTGSFASSHPFGEFSSLTSSMTETSNPDLHLFLSNNLAESSIW
ncbi:hypothetical protein AGDE_08333 [Angomonas deanei]|uniref:DnaJ domain containing protein n=1 Tax=Angomonas deanei TaxID=59799 RepID=A0A7G2C9H5_9TRYP|nr:hypothetical protein AGDE_08333 [Angomonas deanei]CAD2214662.1 hypothetical protein, conserved [Angomonas deanei]|eukprot:EPY33139.1 hypothetical protein AGDE_08333 [Angomonas deanei]